MTHTITRRITVAVATTAITIGLAAGSAAAFEPPADFRGPLRPHHASRWQGRREGGLMPSDPSDRVTRARIAAYKLHASHDSREITRPARATFLARFEREVDPKRKLPPAERARRAEFAKKAYFAKLALKSAQARRKRAAARKGGGDA